MKKKYLLLSTTLIVALFFNLNLRFDLSKSQDRSLLEMSNIAYASSEGDDEGLFAKTQECGGDFLWYEDPVDPSNSRYIWVDKFETVCLLSWPNWGCTAEACAFADYAY